MRKVLGLLLVLTTTALPGSLLAQVGIGVAGHVGTMGVGVDAAISPARNIGLRAGANIMPVQINGTFSDVDFSVELQSPQFMALVDLYL